jgi:hypothetical protein
MSYVATPTHKYHASPPDPSSHFVVAFRHVFPRDYRVLYGELFPILWLPAATTMTLHSIPVDRLHALSARKGVTCNIALSQKRDS